MGKYANLKGDVSSISRRALTRMREENIPTTPDYFQLFFEYYAKVNQSLSNEMESLTPITPETLDTLYEKHFLKQNEQARSLQDESQKVVALILEKLSKTLDHFGEDRQKKIESLQERVGCGDIPLEEVVAILGEEISSVAREYSQMRNSLQESLQRITQLKERYDELGNKSRRDFLTGVLNRQALDELLQACSRDERKFPLALILMDLDDFKSINDQYGHLCGDSMLRQFADILMREIRRDDYIFRFGGEEFVVLLPRTNLAAAFQLAEHLRRTITGTTFTTENREVLRLSTSCGVAACSPDESPESFLNRADKAMYASKRSGKNKTTLASHP